MKNLTAKTTFILFLTIVFSHISQASSLKTATKNYTVKEFSNLKVISAFQVEYIYSDENKVSVEIDEDVAKNLFVGNSGNTLIIKLKDCNYCKTHTLKAKVYGKSLSGINISGASTFTSNYVFNENNMSIKTSGASKVSINLKTTELDIDISGASKVIVSGNAIHQTIEASGASNYNAEKCNSNNVHINATGASKVIIDCTETLDADASGASSIRYISKPKTINQNTSGASSVREN
jgi:hypothetical protein